MDSGLMAANPKGGGTSQAKRVAQDVGRTADEGRCHLAEDTEVKLLRTLVCELLGVDSNLLASTLRRAAITAAVGGDSGLRPHETPSRSSSGDNIRSGPLPVVQESRFERSPNGTDFSCEQVDVANGGEKEGHSEDSPVQLSTPVSLRDQISLSAFREACNTSQSRSLQPVSAPANSSSISPH